jgi:Alpha-2,8-polysialyltransferase (POLYST)
VIRIFGCQGSIQLVAAVVAGDTCLEGPTAGLRNYLVLHDLALPRDQMEDFARVLERMAPLAGTWERIVYLPPPVVQSLREQARTGGRRALLALLNEQIGTDWADEIYLTQNRIPFNQLLLNAYRSARKICYGDGIGVNFSHDYFHRPADPAGGGSQPTTHLQSMADTRKRSRLRAFVSRSRQALLPLSRIVTRGESWMTEVPFDLYCLLLPNLFDETVQNYRLTDPEAYRRLFARFGALLDGESSSACGPLIEALTGTLKAVVLLTANFSEAERMDRERELAGYLEVMAGVETDRRAALIIKPHPRDSVEKIAELRARLANAFRRVVVLDQPLLFYLTFEVIWEKYFVPGQPKPPGLRTEVVCFSSACLSLEYLYLVPCTIGFGEERVRKLFHPQWVDLRLRHEADLRQAVEAIRSGRFGPPVATRGKPQQH